MDRGSVSGYVVRFFADASLSNDVIVCLTHCFFCKSLYTIRRRCFDIRVIELLPMSLLHRTDLADQVLILSICITSWIQCMNSCMRHRLIRSKAGQACCSCIWLRFDTDAHPQQDQRAYSRQRCTEQSSIQAGRQGMTGLQNLAGVAPYPWKMCAKT